MANRDEALRSAIAELKEDDFTDDGRPQVHALNARLRAKGEEPVTSEERNDAWAAYNDRKASDDQQRAASTEEQKADAKAEQDKAMLASRTGEPVSGAGVEVPQSSGQDVPIRNQSMSPADASRVEATMASRAPTAGTEAPPEGDVRIRIDSAQSDPVVLYVHGVGRFTLAIGKEHELPEEAVDALRNSDVRFEVLDAAG